MLDLAISPRFTRNVNVGEVKMAVNAFGGGRSFYITGLPYSFQNARLLYRALCWCARKDWRRAYADNRNVECHYYPAAGKYAVVNNSDTQQVTDFYDCRGNRRSLTLAPMAIDWLTEE